MYCIYNYILERNHVSRVYSVATVLYLQFVLHVMLLCCKICFVLLHRGARGSAVGKGTALQVGRSRV
jgi:hypothetical protein